MSEYVFILGAGASHEAGAPLMNDFLDVAYDLRKELRDTDQGTGDFELVFRALTALEASLAKAKIDLRNVESVFAAFEMAKLLRRLGPLNSEDVARLPNAITRVIERTLEQKISFPVIFREGQQSVAPPVPYDGFVNLIRDLTEEGKHTVSVTTFNYDVCLDYAFHYNSILVNYAVDETRTQSLKLLKLHGSINWMVCPTCKRIAPWYMEKFFSNHNWGLRPGDTNSVRLNISSRLKEFTHCGDIPAEAPALVPPSFNKGEHYNQLAPVWYTTAAQLAEAENIIVLGYSLPETDQFFRYLYALGTTGGKRLKRFLVFNPDSEVETRFRSLLGPMAADRFSFYSSSFREAIGLLPGLLDIPRTRKRS